MAMVHYQVGNKQFVKLYLFDPKQNKVTSTKLLTLGKFEKFDSTKSNFGAPFCIWKQKRINLVNVSLSSKRLPDTQQEYYISRFLLVTHRLGKLLLCGFTLDHPPLAIEHFESPLAAHHSFLFPNRFKWIKPEEEGLLFKEFEINSRKLKDQNELKTLKF